MSVKSTCGEHRWVFLKRYLPSPEDESDVPHKNKECVLHILIENEFVV